MEENIGGRQDNYKDISQEGINQSLNNLDDLHSEPSINLRRKYKGKYQILDPVTIAGLSFSTF